MKSYCVTTFGCQMNVHDSDRMHEVLRGAGLTEASEDEADVVILNTCSVREKAEQKLLSELGKLALTKKERPTRTLVVAGCVAQQEGDRLLKRRLGIDIVIGPDNIRELPLLLHDVEAGGLPLVRTVFDLEAPRFLTAETAPLEPAADPTISTFVTTMKGCNERCTFCIVPTTRGPERYRPSSEIVSEIRTLAARGTKEVTLLGQTVNSYRDPEGAMEKPDVADPDESEFAALLRTIANEVPTMRLRYTSPHPRHLTPSLIEAHGSLDGLARHVHLPVQSGSNAVLRRMLRRYTREEFVTRVGALRQRTADRPVTLSTDIIVGFPGETEEDFQATLSLVEEVGFIGVFGFKYSERPGTPALRLRNDVSEADKSTRLARLFALSEALVAEHLVTMVGETLNVLVVGRAKKAQAGDTPTFTGRSDRNEIVHVQDARAERLVGQIVPIRAVRAFKHSLLGELTEDAIARAAAAPRPVQKRSLPIATTA